MSGYNISLDKGLLPDFLTDQNGLSKLVEDSENGKELSNYYFAEHEVEAPTQKE